MQPRFILARRFVPLSAAVALAVLAVGLLASREASATTAPNDPYYSSQWAAGRIRADQAWDVVTGGTVRVAIVDTGVAPLADLQGQLGTGYNSVQPGGGTFDDFGSYGMGTQVAGIVGAIGNNGRDMAGMNWRVTIVPVKVCTATGWCPPAALADGINWAVSQNVQIIHTSLGTFESSPEVDAAVANAVSRGVIVIASAGNSATRVGFPGALPGVIAVGSTDSSDVVSTYSGRGPQLDLVAPGEGVMTLVSGGCCLERAGSPLAAAHVTGAAALLLAAGVPQANVQSALVQGTRDLGAAGRDDLYGHGILDVCRSLSVAGVPCPVQATPTATNTATNTSTSTPTRTSTPVPPTSTPTRTNTPVPPTSTPTRTNTPVAIATSTPTRTNTPVAVASSTPTRTPTQVAPTSTPTRVAPTATYTPRPACKKGWAGKRAGC